MSSGAAEGLLTGGPPPLCLQEVTGMPAQTLQQPLSTVGVDPDLEPARAAQLLLDQGMPPEEIRAVLGSLDPRVVRRHLELHRERLVEELYERRRALASLERVLVARAQGRRTEPSSSTVQNGLCATSHGWPSGSTKTPE